MVKTHYPPIGKKAPDFSLPDTNGAQVKLSKLKGQPVVVYFYPKDDTSGCTVEACQFTDHYKQFQKKGVLVFGISKDDVESHKKFIKKHNIGIPLLSDESGKVLEKYGVWQEKSNYGKTYMGIARTTFIIDAQGNIAQIFEKVTPDGHAKEVLDAVDEIK